MRTNGPEQQVASHAKRFSPASHVQRELVGALLYKPLSQAPLVKTGDRQCGLFPGLTHVCLTPLLSTNGASTPRSETAVPAPSLPSTSQPAAGRTGARRAFLLRTLPGRVSKARQGNLGKTVFRATSWGISRERGGKWILGNKQQVLPRTPSKMQFIPGFALQPQVTSYLKKGTTVPHYSQRHRLTAGVPG